MIVTSLAPHSPELDVLDHALGEAPAPQRRAARDLLGRMRRIEQMSGASLVNVLEAIEQAVASAPAPAMLTAHQAAALALVGADGTPRPAVDRPSVRTALAYQRLLRTALSTAEAAQLLDVDESRIRQRIAENTLLAARVKNAHRLPAFQFADDGELPGWSRVAARIPRGRPLTAVDRFLHTPQADLMMNGESVTPIDWLSGGGDPATVAALVGE